MTEAEKNKEEKSNWNWLLVRIHHIHTFHQHFIVLLDN